MPIPPERIHEFSSELQAAGFSPISARAAFRDTDKLAQFWEGESRQLSATPIKLRQGLPLREWLAMEELRRWQIVTFSLAIQNAAYAEKLRQQRAERAGADMYHPPQ